jgi:hypothetical protein
MYPNRDKRLAGRHVTERVMGIESRECQLQSVREAVTYLKSVKSSDSYLILKRVSA